MTLLSPAAACGDDVNSGNAGTDDDDDGGSTSSDTTATATATVTDTTDPTNTTDPSTTSGGTSTTDASSGGSESTAADSSSGGISCDEGLTPCGDMCIDLQTDPMNCLDCGEVCPDGANGVPACDGGCGFTCDDGFGDCDPEADGCEAMLDTVDACGSCDNSCEEGDSCEAPLCSGTRELLLNGAFDDAFTDWMTVNNPDGAIDQTTVFTETAAGSGVVTAGLSSGPAARTLYQDFEVPVGITAAAFSVDFAQNPGAVLSPDLVQTIMVGSGGAKTESNAFRVDLIDPAEDVFDAPILFELYLPVDMVGTVGVTWEETTIDSGELLSFLQSNEGETLRLRFGHVETTFPWQSEIDAASVAVEVSY
ncbi:MAG: hypothetical protein ACRBN8_02170 [Nannocystales bacterium]